jgi:hypothetical protein
VLRLEAYLEEAVGFQEELHQLLVLLASHLGLHEKFLQDVWHEREIVRWGHKEHSKDLALLLALPVEEDRPREPDVHGERWHQLLGFCHRHSMKGASFAALIRTSDSKSCTLLFCSNWAGKNMS